MARQAYGIKANDGVIFVDKSTKEIIESVTVAETNVPGEWIAASEDGKVYGTRHESKRAARDYVADSLGIIAHYMNASHPAVRQLLVNA